MSTSTTSTPEPRLLRRSANVAVAVLSIAVLGLATVLGGARGVVYIAFFLLLLTPGLPLGFRLFGRHHAAGWIAGGLIGYALSAMAMWLPADIGLSWRGWIPVAWMAVAAATWTLVRERTPLVALQEWRERDSLALCLVLLVVPLLVGAPFSRIGEMDDEGSRRYRAYFTADFLWHVALTAELAKADAPPRNPYLGRRPLNYYWAYFVPPAMLYRATGLFDSLQACLTVNALGAGLLFVSSIFLGAWCTIPRAGPVAASVVLAILAASAEGLFVVRRLLLEGRPLSDLRELNVDAMTSWVFQGLTIDGLPRSLWYTPQHATACALGLVALVVPATAGASVRPVTALFAGTALGCAIVFSPFLGGVFCLMYGLTVVWRWIERSPRRVGSIAAAATAAVPACAGLGWCVANRTFEGAGGAVAFGLSERSSTAPLATLALALGPVLALALGGLIAGRGRGYRWEHSIVGLVVGLGLFYFVTLTKEPVWVGWRAGQILLVTTPALVAALFATLCDRGRLGLAGAAGGLALFVGVPTTAIDAFNAQDVENTAMGPGFHWTVVVPPDTRAATAWIRTHTPRDAIVQMSIGPRGRETWTLIPTFAERRMAAGQPISLLYIPEYDEGSAEVDAIYGATDPAEAWRRARAQRVDYLYVDRVERAAFSGDAIAKFDNRQYFLPVFRQGDAAVFQVR